MPTDYIEKDRLEAERFANVFIREVNEDHNDFITMGRDVGCRIRDHIEYLRRQIAKPPVPTDTTERSQ